MVTPVYSLNRSRLERSRTRNASVDGQGARRVSSGPTGMYTEHIYWARSVDNSKRASKTRLNTKELLAKQPSSQDSGNYPVLAWSEG